MEHPHVATVLNNLAALLERQADYEQAEILYMRSLAIAEKAFGSGSPAVRGLLKKIAGLYAKTQRFEEAKAWEARASHTVEGEAASGASRKPTPRTSAQ